MRQLFKNDILRLAKEVKDIKQWAVYFLLHENEIVYVGCSQTPYVRICIHLNNFHVDKYHVLHFSSKEEAFQAEKTYIKAFQPFQNNLYNDTFHKDAKVLASQQFEDKKKGKTLTNADIADIDEKKLLAERAVEEAIEKADQKVNIPNNSYIKKADTFYLKIDNNLIKTKMESNFVVYKNKKYHKPTKLFGNINELIK